MRTCWCRKKFFNWVLTKGFLDDGRGYARGKVLKHKHELDSGRTSDITFNPLIYKKKNNNIELVDSESKKLHKYLILTCQNLYQIKK